MNYFEIIDKEKQFLNKNLIFSKLPILKSLVSVHLRREFISESIGNPYNKTNMLLSSHASYLSFFNISFQLRRLLYFFQKSRISNNNCEQVLFSPYMCSRFPDLVKRINRNYNVVFFITALNFRFSRHQDAQSKIKMHNIFFNKHQTKLLKELFYYIKIDFENKVDLRKLNKDFLEKIELYLECTVQKVVDELKRQNITQFITCYDNRFDDLIIAHACKKLNLPSKELAHGVNNYTLKNGQTMAPTTLDYLLVWKEQMRNACLDYGGDKERIQIVGYPKYTVENSAKLQKKYPVKKQIIYFSQPIYDIFDSPSYKVNTEVIELEKKFRLELLENLNLFAQSNDYKVIIRYHNGEKSGSKYSREDELNYINQNTKIEVSQNSFEEDLYQSEICLGINSSCIFESFLIRKKCFQIRFPLNEYTYHNEVTIINLKSIKNLLSLNPNLPSDYNYGFINDNLLMSIGKVDH